MKRYLNSFFITTSIYLIAGIAFYFTFDKLIVVKEKKEETVTKISLSSVAIQEVVQEEPTPVVEEIIPEPLVEKVVEKPVHKPKPIEKKVHKEKQKPKKQNKPVEEVVQEVVEEPTLTVENTKNTEVTKEVAPSLSKAQINSIENEYLSKVRAKVERHKIYPKIAKRLKQTGKVEINFDILKDGKVTNVKIAKKSKFEKLDEASIEILTKIGFFEAIPNETNRTIWNITIPIDYQIN